MNRKDDVFEMGFFNEVYRLVKKIPKGRVTTYGEIARALGTRDARRVGWALHANRDPQVPCHRVVNREGGLAEEFAFDGWREQKRRLVAEGVSFSGERQVDLGEHRFKL